MAALALDVGGTKVAAALVGPDGALVRTARRPTAIDDAWAACVAALWEVAEDEQVSAVGIGCARPIDGRTATVSPLNIPAWRNFPLVDRVTQEFPGADVRLGGDGECMAMAEYRFGAGRGVPNLLGVVASTGVGGGLMLDGQVLESRSGNAGHIGHVVVEPGGATDARAGGELAVAALARAGMGLGQAFASVAALVDVDLVVLGGGFAAAGAPLWEPMRAAVATHARLSFARELRVVPAALGAESGLVGRRRWCCSYGDSHRYACAV